MATYVLVAGAWHGSWCWSTVASLLEAVGHQVLMPDLLGMADGEQTITIEPVRRWADQIADVIRREHDPVILVGHSRAGIVISEVAERVPERIEWLIYLSAFLLQDGHTIAELVQRSPNGQAFGRAICVHDDGTTTFDRSQAARFLYSETPAPLIEAACARLVAEPAAAVSTPVRVTDERFGSVRRAYIECTRDRAMLIGEQRAMQQTVGVSVVEQLDTDHSAFFSLPDTLVHALERIRSSD